MSLQPIRSWPIFQFLNLYTVGKTHRTQTQMHTDIHASSGIRTHDPSVRAGEDGSCLRPRGHYDFRFIFTGIKTLGKMQNQNKKIPCRNSTHFYLNIRLQPYTVLRNDSFGNSVRPLTKRAR
jgi:hypothetical protein